MAKKTLNPGDKAPNSGQYAIVGPRGGYYGEITSIEGNNLPPTPKRGQKYKLVDKTKVKRGSK